MSVQLVLKNSSVQDKEATAAQLAVGELALNYHSSGPFLQCEDSAGNIWRLGGVVIASTAPSSPSKGAWWLDSDDDHLYFYDGTSWIEIQTGEIVPGDITEGTARQLLQTNAAGTATEWTSNIDVPGTLDVTGVATFDNNVVITGNLTVNGTTTTIDTTTLVVEDKNIELGSVDSPTDSTADGGGITLKGATDKTINWVNATDAWTSSERFSVPLGAQGTPSLTFTGDANTGIYSPGADQVAISTGGSGRLFVDSTGKVSIGSASADVTFNVSDAGSTTAKFQSSGANCRIAFADSGSTYWWHQRIGSQGNNLIFETGQTERLRITSDGKVGVGTSSPATNLTIEGANNSEMFRMYGTGTGNTRGLSVSLFQVAGSVDNAGVDFNAQQASVGQLRFSTLSTPRMLIDQSGRVGIGTTSPQSKLVVSDAGSNGIEFIPEVTTDQNLILSYDRSGSARSKLEIDSSELLFTNANAELMRIDSSGRLLVGTTDGTTSFAGDANNLVIVESGNTAKIVVHRKTEDAYGGILRLGKTRSSTSAIDNNDEVGTIEFFGHDSTNTNSRLAYIGCYAEADGATNDVPGRLVFATTADNAGAPTERMRIDSSGRLGLGTSSPGSYEDYASKLVVANTAGNNGMTIVSASNGVGALFFADGTVGNEKNRGGIYYNHIDDSLQALTAGSARVHITSGGNVGIGSTLSGAAAYNRLVVNSPDSSCWISLQSAQTGSTINSDGLEIGLNGSNEGHIWLRENAALLLATNNTERARIDSSGRLLVGTSSALTTDSGHIIQAADSTGVKLTLGRSSTSVAADVGLAQLIGYSNGGGTYEQSGSIAIFSDGAHASGDKPGRLVFSTTADGSSSPTERVRIESGGKTKFSGGAYGIERTATASAFDLNEGNFWTCGAIAVPNPTNQVAGMMGSLRVTAAPTSFAANWNHPGGTYTAPTTFPAVAPFYVQASGTILLGSWTEGIA